MRAQLAGMVVKTPGQDGDQDHKTPRVPKGSCVLWARLIFWSKLTLDPSTFSSTKSIYKIK